MRYAAVTIIDARFDARCTHSPDGGALTDA
jgi:hypothetical protein